jgi:hypothetical protein
MAQSRTAAYTRPATLQLTFAVTTTAAAGVTQRAIQRQGLASACLTPLTLTLTLLLLQAAEDVGQPLLVVRREGACIPQESNAMSHRNPTNAIRARRYLRRVRGA